MTAVTVAAGRAANRPMSHLRINPAVLLATADDGYLAYDVESGRLHRLNATAALLAELCNGTRNREEILAAVVPLLGAGAREGCSAWLDQALAQELLSTRPAASPPRVWTATELHQLAGQLRNQDRVLAAFICQQSAAEAAPDDPQQWYALAELAHIVGRRADARAAYERYHAAHPEDVEAAHLLIALRDEPPPSRAPDEYVEQLYSYFASFYDENMCGDLDYRAPDLLAAALDAALGPRDQLQVLDLGCGTGLFGRLVRPRAARLVGIDLSPAMIERSAQRGIYDRLETAEITAWLGRQPAQPFDLIAVCDTLIYFGDLRQVLPRAAKHLAPNGVLGFTVEKGETFPFRLTDSGRFAHHQDHLREVAQEAGLRLVSQTAEVLRYEYGSPVTGWVTVLSL